jgi:decaprenylphospho-beta-D-erythro-pentofuranosid-2-ulose 2-reductase
MRDGVGRIQNILVIGGSSEIGTAIAGTATSAGPATVLLAGRDPVRLKEAAARLERADRTVHLLDYRAEMPAPEVTGLVDQAAALVGDLDVVLVCVGLLGDEADLAVDTAATEASLRANLLGPALAVQAGAHRLAGQGHGVLVVLSSVAGLRPRSDLPAYGAAKAGLDTYARALQARMRGCGARIVVVRPGQVRTRMSAGLPDAPFTVDPDEVARTVARHLHGGRSVIYVPGVLRPVTGVLRALPAPLFRRVTTAARRRAGTIAAARTTGRRG